MLAIRPIHSFTLPGLVLQAAKQFELLLERIEDAVILVI